MEVVASDMNVKEKYTRIESKVKDQNRIQTNKTKKPHLSEETLLLKKDKKENLREISYLSKKIRERMIKDRKIRRTRSLENIIIKTGGTRKALKKFRENGKEWIPKLKKKETSTTTTTRRTILNIATNYYREVYSKLSTIAPHDTVLNDINKFRDRDKIPEILLSEVEKAIKSQMIEKAPGPDRISNEVMRGTIEEISPLLTKIFNKILYSGNFPSQWAKSHVVLIHKKGPKDDIGNYRPISLISNIYKIFAKVILERITNKLDENQRRTGRV